MTARPVPTEEPDEPPGPDPDRAASERVAADRVATDRVASLVAARVRDVPDFPRPGILFKDLTPLFADGPAFRAAVDAVARRPAPGSFDVVVGIEARGFLVAAAVAHAAGTGVVPVRKAGKLPWRSVAARYELEYGEAAIEMHEDAFAGARRALIVDDVLATGGTLAATADLVARAGGQVTGMSVLLELAFLGGRGRLAGYDLHSLLTV
jgi:adenine phosphoribosyltransferase